MTRTMSGRIHGWFFGGAVALVAIFAAAEPAIACTISVNGERLSANQVRALQDFYGVQVPCGSYWLDPNNGDWGHMDADGIGPTEGRLVPRSLRSDGSAGLDASTARLLKRMM